MFNCLMVLRPYLSSPCWLCMAEGGLCRLHFPGCLAKAASSLGLANGRHWWEARGGTGGGAGIFLPQSPRCAPWQWLCPLHSSILHSLGAWVVSVSAGWP